MVFRVVSLLLYSFIFKCCTPFMSKEIEFDHVALRASFVEGFYNATVFKVNKFNHTAYALNVDAEFYVDVDEDFEVEVFNYYKRLMSNEYSKSVIHIPRSSLCKVIDKFYPLYAMESMKDHSNLPQYKSPNKFCPLKKVYFIRKIIVI